MARPVGSRSTASVEMTERTTSISMRLAPRLCGNAFKGGCMAREGRLSQPVGVLAQPLKARRALLGLEAACACMAIVPCLGSPWDARSCNSSLPQPTFPHGEFDQLRRGVHAR